MNCARVLHAFSHPQHAVNPVEMAMCLSLSQQQPLYQLLSMSRLKPTQLPCKPTDNPVRTGHQFPHPPLSSSSSLPSHSLLSSHLTSENIRSCLRRQVRGVNKKRVVFADTKGLALTAVRIFIREPSYPTSTLVVRPSRAKLEGQQSISDKLNHYKLRLGFPQPILDLKAFLARLQDMKVQLESCSISDHSLSGKVYVSHVSTEKVVCVKVTFDSWRNHYDIPCTFLGQHCCGGSDVDVFTFDLSLTHNIDPRERIEFCVSFRPGPDALPHWDNNMGQNYTVYMEKERSDPNRGNTKRCYPTLSKHKPPIMAFTRVHWYAELS